MSRFIIVSTSVVIAGCSQSIDFSAEASKFSQATREFTADVPTILERDALKARTEELQAAVDRLLPYTHRLKDGDIIKTLLSRIRVNAGSACQYYVESIEEDKLGNEIPSKVASSMGKPFLMAIEHQCDALDKNVAGLK